MYGLFDLDEGFYAAAAGEMIRRGDWITPWYNGAPWFEKPILIYWTAIPAIQLFGESWGPRLPSVIATILTATVMTAFAARVIGEWAALWVGPMYVASPLVLGIGRMMLTDALLVLALNLAFASYYFSLTGDARWRWITGAALGLGVLAKGPVALILFGGVFIAFRLLCRDPRLRHRGGWAGGILALGVVIALWYVPAYLTNPQQFVQEFLIEQNFKRFTGGDEAHRVPWWSHPIYYPAVLLVGLAPWSFRAFRRVDWQARTASHTYLLCWFLVPLLFFTVSGSKLPHYILPSAAPLILLIGMGLKPTRQKWRQLPMRVGGMVAYATAWGVGATLIFATYHRAAGFEEAQNLAKVLASESSPGALYQFGRQTGEVTITTELQETTLPSLVFYLDRVTLMTDDREEVAQSEAEWMMTRRGRLQPDDLEWFGERGITLVPDALAANAEHFELYRLRRIR